MSFWEKITGWITKDSDELLSFRLPTEQVQGNYDEDPAAAGRHYFRVKLSRMFLKKKVHFGKTWFPAAHSLVKCSFGDASVEIPNIADTSKLFKQQEGTGDVVAKNFHLTPLLPFNGGTVKLAAGLFAMEGEDYLNRVITVMSDFAGLLAVPQLSAALKVAQPLANGIQTLFGASDGRMHLGYHNSYVGAENGPDDTANTLKEGYVAVVRAPSNAVDKSRLFVVEDVLRTGESVSKNQSFTEHDYMLLHIELREERDDYDQLSNIKKPFDEALEALGNLEQEKAKTHIRLALVAALQSPELTKADKTRVTERLKADYLKAKKSLEFDGLVASPEGGLQESVPRAGSAEQALDRGLPTYDILLGDL